MSILTRSILERLNEAEAVKKPYGDKPEEGKKEKSIEIYDNIISLDEKNCEAYINKSNILFE